MLEVEDFQAGVNLGLVYLVTNGSNSLVMAAKELARSKQWHDKVTKMGLGIPDLE